jgi:hypothetical protein
MMTLATGTRRSPSSRQAWHWNEGVALSTDQMYALVRVITERGKGWERDSAGGGVGGGGVIRGLQPYSRDADRGGHSQSHGKTIDHVVERWHAPRRESKRDVGEGREGGGEGWGGMGGARRAPALASQRRV